MEVLRVESKIPLLLSDTVKLPPGGTPAANVTRTGSDATPLTTVNGAFSTEEASWPPAVLGNANSTVAHNHRQQVKEGHASHRARLCIVLSFVDSALAIVLH